MPAALARSSIITGPAKCVYSAGSPGTPATFWTKGDFTFTPKLETFDVNVSAIGNVTKRVKQRMAEIVMTPDGEWTSAVQQAIYPYAQQTNDIFPIGTTIGNANGTDASFVITPYGGYPITGRAAFITKLPSLKFSSVETRIGSMTFSLLGENTKQWNDASPSLFAIAGSSGTTNFSGFDESTILTKGTLATWGADAAAGALTTGFDTLDGFTVDFDLKYKTCEIDTVGIIDYRFASLDITIKCTPVGPTEKELLDCLNIQGSDSTGRGGDLATDFFSGDFVITDLDGVVVFSGRQMSLIDAPMRYGQDYQLGECTWASTRQISSGGALKSVFNFGVLN